MVTEAFAPAKINLALHVTGQRSDGYHMLDSLVMFADVGDIITVSKAQITSLTVTGPMANCVPTGSDNLVMRAAALMGTPAKITLEKHLPAAAGIGGGSSDAAACLRALARLYNVPLPERDALMTLGADVPVCMENGLSRMRGAGEMIDLLGMAPNWSMILVNPGVLVPTAAVFAALTDKQNAPMPDDFDVQADWLPQIDWIARQRNDLETSATLLEPRIGAVLEALRMQSGCTLARMSGSGATCFAIMSDDDSCDAAVAQLRRDHPDWWVMPTEACGVKFS